MSNKGLLCLVLFVALVATSVAHPKDADVKTSKRAIGCLCHSQGGDYWFFRFGCPDGHGYYKHCTSVGGICCVKWKG
uniref:mRNA n=1 Tax=Oulactis sp. TaxID=2093647 RepID=A0A4D8XNC5_OULSP|nr:mRNA [Oulactis sp. MM-2018]SZA34136.1 mRNA [Oulactis sp. MM-2018]